MPKRIETALQIALDVHSGQTDKAGQPYILHPLRLMHRLHSDDEKIVALLHDVVEDGELSLSDLRARGFGESIVAAIDCLTRREQEDYQAFIERVASNPLATRVKIEDLRDNMDVSRLKTLTEKDLARVAKYHQALNRLSSHATRNS